jgi:hypothetical protein
MSPHHYAIPAWPPSQPELLLAAVTAPFLCVLAAALAAIGRAATRTVRIALAAACCLASAALITTAVISLAGQQAATTPTEGTTTP